MVPGLPRLCSNGSWQMRPRRFAYLSQSQPAKPRRYQQARRYPNPKGVPKSSQITSDNPRSEDPLAIIRDVLQGSGVDVEIDPDRRSAIQRAIGLAEPDDVVVIAGKGHEQGQEISGSVHPFDDRAVVREALAELRAAP